MLSFLRRHGNDGSDADLNGRHAAALEEMDRCSSVECMQTACGRAVLWMIYRTYALVACRLAASQYVCSAGSMWATVVHQVRVLMSPRCCSFCQELVWRVSLLDLVAGAAYFVLSDRLCHHRSGKPPSVVHQTRSGSSQQDVR